jgi:hypothetical protein
MKKIISISVLLPALLVVYLHAQSKHATGYEQATIVSVDKYTAQPTSFGDSLSDAPLQTDSYAYNIGVRLNCSVYVGRYESATDYLPSVFAPNHTVDVRMDKHLMFVSLPEGDRIVKMGIISHKRLNEQTCPTNG